MLNINQIIGQNLKLVRTAKGLSQEILSKKVGISGAYLGYLERGQRTPSLDLLDKIASVLETDPAAFLTKSDDEASIELKKLIAILAGKGSEPIKFLSNVAIAYLESIEHFNS